MTDENESLPAGELSAVHRGRTAVIDCVVSAGIDLEFIGQLVSIEHGAATTVHLAPDALRTAPHQIEVIEISHEASVTLRPEEAQPSPSGLGPSPLPYDEAIEHQASDLNLHVVGRPISFVSRLDNGTWYSAYGRLVGLDAAIVDGQSRVLVRLIGIDADLGTAPEEFRLEPDTILHSAAPRP